MFDRLMHLPFGPVTHQAEEHAELPEVVPIEDLTAGALDAAAQEIAQEQEENATWPTATA
jgi:hypothetical protein